MHKNRIKIVDDKDIISNFKVGDRAYFNKLLPETHNEVAEWTRRC